MYTRGDYTGQDLTGTVLTGNIEGSCFHQESPKTEFCHSDSTATFINCNLTNCTIPAGCSVKGGTNVQIIKQNDGEYWEVNGSNEPVEPLNKKWYVSLGLSTDPLDISGVKLDKSIIDKKVLGEI